MKNNYKLLALLLTIVSSYTFAQNRVLSFDGVNDYVNLGSSVATGARTIEMWFNPGVSINSNSSNYYPLVVRDETPNNKEFGLTFMPSSTGFGGQLLFYIYNNSTTSFRIYSNNNSWNAGQWHHVAAVVHPTQGMMLFIDGVKQGSVNSNTLAPMQSSTNTDVGAFGTVSSRRFNGKIDNLKFSNTALYNSNFTTTCTSTISRTTTIALYNFNSNNTSSVIDVSGNNSNGIILGATKSLDSICSNPQNYNCLSFDGINDYLDLGNTVATGARTIEMWFNPGVNITPNSSNYYPLVVRDETPNNKEFGLTFMPNSTGFGGQLLFYVYNNSTTSFRIYSNSNTWNAGQWYHVAAVVHPTQGMMLFIDGVKQNSVNSSTLAPIQSSTNTDVGAFGTVNSRRFNGKIDNLKFSSSSLYNSNYTPTCHIVASNSTTGLYTFDGNSSSNRTIDSSGNNNNGLIIGATGVTDTICPIVITSIKTQTDTKDKLLVYPNPFQNSLTFDFGKNEGANAQHRVQLYSLDWRLLLEKSGNSKLILETQSLPQGMYFYLVFKGDNVINSSKLVKN